MIMDNRMKITSQWCDKTMNGVIINDNYCLLTAELSGPNHHQRAIIAYLYRPHHQAVSIYLHHYLYLILMTDWFSEICFWPIKSCGLFIHMNVIQFFCMVPFFVILIKLVYKGFVCNYNWLSVLFCWLNCFC